MMPLQGSTPTSEALVSPHLDSRNFVAFFGETFYKKLNMQILHFVVNQKCARKPNFLSWPKRLQLFFRSNDTIVATI